MRSVVGTIDSQLLRETVARSQSWRGVLRHLGLPASSSSSTRILRQRCDVEEVSYHHFAGQRAWLDAELASATRSAATWADLTASLGYAANSGSARSTVRARARLLGIDVAHLDPRRLSVPPPVPGSICPENLRSAGPMLVAAVLTLQGSQVSWPLEPAPYDLLVESRASGSAAARLSRVQVKTATRRQSGTYICFLTRSRYVAESRWAQREKYPPDAVDHFGVVDGDLSVYLIPYAVVADRSAIHVRQYAQFLVGRLPAPSMYASHAPGSVPDSGL